MKGQLAGKNEEPKRQLMTCGVCIDITQAAELMAGRLLPQPIKDLDGPLGEAILGSIFEQKGNSTAVHELQARLDGADNRLVGW